MGIRDQGVSREFGLRGIIVIKAFYGIVFFVIGLGILALINKDISDLAEQAAISLGIDPENGYLLVLLEWLTGVSPKQIIATGIGTILYSALLLTMAWGLHLRQAWAEWLTIVATGLLIPLEIYELLRTRHLTYLLVLFVNAAIVWYLLRRRVHGSAAPQESLSEPSGDAIVPPAARS